MSVEFCVEVSDDFADGLEGVPSSEVEEALREALKRLAEAERATEKQDELHERMGLDSDESGVEELSDEELKTEIQRFLRGERRTDPRLDSE